ncbi:hypothetical protein Nepgr_014388 [Nepenthes gracilis]|uniref:Protein CHUP1, chloroplastic n=1 Tax=Nepenthes gracilis TaxID=150966 RepID=A0AAD3SJY6_NEPGR|nr:hypothetical protein Nepgr_014388 [Nepenthes gracilis]
MQQGNDSGIAFFVEDLAAVLEMNRLLEKENQELKQEVTLLKGKIDSLKAHDIERKAMLWKKVQYSIAKETTCKKPDQQKERQGIPEPPQKPPKLSFELRMAASGMPPPPPPPPSRSLVESRAVCRVPEVIELYRYLTKRVAQRENNRTVPTAIPAEANTRNMIEEIKNRSTYLSAIKSDVETREEFINFLLREVEGASFTEISSLEAFAKWMDEELSCLADERAVLKHFPRWPERKADAIREAACCYRGLKNLEAEVSSFKVNPEQPLSRTLRRIQELQDRQEHTGENYKQCGKDKRRHMHAIQGIADPLEWMLDTDLLGQIKLSSLRLATEYMKSIAKELQCAKCYNAEDLMLQGVKFAFQVHQFAGGFDTDTKHAFEELKQLHSTL